MRRKRCVRSCLGSSSTSAGVPCSTIVAVVHEDDAVGDLAGEAHLVRHDDHRHAGLGQPPDHRQHLADQLGIERRGRLVEQHQPRRDRERAGDRDALLLAAGEPVRQVVGVVGQADARQQAERELARLLRVLAVDLDRRLA